MSELLETKLLSTRPSRIAVRSLVRLKGTTPDVLVAVFSVPTWKHTPHMRVKSAVLFLRVSKWRHKPQPLSPTPLARRFPGVLPLTPAAWAFNIVLVAVQGSGGPEHVILSPHTTQPNFSYSAAQLSPVLAVSAATLMQEMLVDQGQGRPATQHARKVFQNETRHIKLPSNYNGHAFAWEAVVPQAELPGFLYPSLKPDQPSLAQNGHGPEADTPVLDAASGHCWRLNIHRGMNLEALLDQQQGSGRRRRCVDTFQQYRDHGEKQLRERLVTKAQHMLHQDELVMKGFISRAAHRAFRGIADDDSPAHEAARLYYSLLKDAKAKASLRAVIGASEYKKTVLKESHRRAWLIPRRERDLEVGVAYYQNLDLFGVLRNDRKRRWSVSKRDGPRMEGLVGQLIVKQREEQSEAFKKTQGRLKFFEKYKRTLDALNAGHKTTGADPSELGDASLSPTTAHRNKATDNFLWHCENLGLAPEPSLMLKQDDPELNLQHRGIGDLLGLAFARSMPFMDHLVALNIADNRLTDVSLVEILTACAEKPMRSLDISNNPLGGATVPAIVTFVHSRASTLIDLNLADGKLQPQDLASITAALVQCTVMTQLNLRSNFMDIKACQNIATMLQGPTPLQRLDMAWNAIGPSGGVVIGKALAVNNWLHWLDMTSNGIGNEGGQAIASGLKTNKRLRTLVLKQNALGGVAAITLAHMLQINKTLQLLELDSNPLTEEGGRAIFRTIVSGIRCRVTLKGCTYDYAHDLRFSYTAPRLYAPYFLDLSSLLGMAIVFEILSISSRNPRCQLVEVQLYKNERRVGGVTKIALDHARKEGDRFGTVINKGTGAPFEPPTTGFLSFSIKFRRRLPDEMDDVLTPREMSTLVRYLVSMDRHQFESCLALVSDDIYVTTGQVKYLLAQVRAAGLFESDMDACVSVLARIYPRIVDCRNLYSLLLTQLPAVADRHIFASRVGLQTFFCNSLNPTGQWRVDLSRKSHRDALMVVAALNAEESLASKTSSGRQDTSQEGNWNNYRNCTLNSRLFVLDNDNVDELPRVGLLEFDYVSTTRPPPHATAISDHEFEILMTHLGAVIPRGVWRLRGVFTICELGLAACAHYFTVPQVLSLLKCLPEGPMQPLVVCTMFGRILDLENFDRVLRTLAKDLADTVIHRLGWLNVWNPLKPEWKYSLDLRKYENRIMTQNVLNLGAMDTGGDAITEDPETQIAVMSLYATLVRLTDVPINSTAVFTYAEVGERGVVPNYPARMAALKYVLLGTKPIRESVTSVVRQYEDLKAAGALRVGPVDQQYAAWLLEKTFGTTNRRRSTMGGGGRRSVTTDLQTTQDVLADSLSLGGVDDSSASVRNKWKALRESAAAGMEDVTRKLTTP